MIGLIKRTFTFLDKEIFNNLYKALVQPHLESGNVIWSSYLKRQSVTSERVQRRATTLNYTQRLKKLDLPTLKYRRLGDDLVEVYKIINQIDDLKVDTFFTPTKLNITRNAEYKLYVEYSKKKKKNVRKFTFSNRIAPAWNALSLTTQSAPNINKFKTLLERDPNLLVNKFDCD